MNKKDKLSLFELIDIHILYIGIMCVVLAPIVLHAISLKFGYISVQEVFCWMLGFAVVVLSPMIVGNFFERRRRKDNDSIRYLLSNYLLIIILCLISILIFSYSVG